MKNTKFLVQAAVIAAVYSVLTIALAPFSYGMIQVRVSEALTILPYFTPAAIPGLFVGCFISNTMSTNGIQIMDMVLGSGATLIAAIGSYLLRGKPILVPLPPVIANGIVVGGMLHYVYNIPSLIACISFVALGELIACYGLGYPLLKYLKKYKKIFELQ